MQADHEQTIDGRLVVRGSRCHQGGVRPVRLSVRRDYQQNNSAATPSEDFDGVGRLKSVSVEAHRRPTMRRSIAQGSSVIMAAAADRVPQRPQHPEHSADDQQDYPNGPEDGDFEHESENEKNDSEGDTATLVASAPVAINPPSTLRTFAVGRIFFICTSWRAKSSLFQGLNPASLPRRTIPKPLCWSRFP